MPHTNDSLLARHIGVGLDQEDPGRRPTPLRRGAAWLPYLRLEDIRIEGTRICFGLGRRHHQFASDYSAYTVADFHLMGMGDAGSIRRLLMDGAVLLFNLEGFSEINYRRDHTCSLPTANGEYRFILEHCWSRVYFSLEGEPFPLQIGGELPGPVKRVTELPPLPHYIHHGPRPRFR